MQLLKITTTPTKYELEVESAKLEYKQDVTPSCEINTTPSQLEIRSQRAEVKIDTYEARKSLGLMNIDDSIQQYAAKGKEHIKRQIREYVEFGEAMSQIHNGAEIGEIVRQKMFEEPELYTAFLPSSRADISWDPAQLEMKYKPADVSLDWHVQQTSYDYKPGSVRVKIVEYAHVDIEYLGGPMYVPPSADPDYEDRSKS